jgi:hypothetical protein
VLFTLYPIYWLADDLSGTPFELARLPFGVVEGVRIESVRERFREDAFDVWEVPAGTETIRMLKRVRYALVYRYEPEPIFIDDDVSGGGPRHLDPDRLVRSVAACLRLIRPMRQQALMMHGTIRDEDGSFDVRGFDVAPPDLIEVPEVQKLFALRNEDADALKTYAPQFLEAMSGNFWKFRMAVQFHELGHFQSLDWRARYLLWSSAIESIYTSHDRNHQGSLVASSRIKWFIGEDTSIYAPGDISDLLQNPGITVGQIIGDLYEVRNFIAHGDKLPDSYFKNILRTGLAGGVVQLEVPLEAASFIIRTSLLKILRDNLLIYFADAAPAERFFGAQKLTKSELRSAKTASAKSMYGPPGS